MTELWQLGALELADRIRNKDVSSREVLEAHLGRVEQCNGSVNAIVRVLADEARSCRRCGRRSRCGRRRSSDDCTVCPCTVKENIDLAGTPTTQGVKALAEAVAPIDAPTVERMRAAGAIPFARTNLPDFGLRVHTDSELHGLTRNPWNPNVTAGGSSGGEGISDRVRYEPDRARQRHRRFAAQPGALLRHRVDQADGRGDPDGDRDSRPRTCTLSAAALVVEGPMARRVADVRAGLEVLAGRHWRDPRSVTRRADRRNRR